MGIGLSALAGIALVAAPASIEAQGPGEPDSAPVVGCSAGDNGFVMPTTGLVFTLPPDDEDDAPCEPLPPPPPPRPPAPSLFRMVAMPIGTTASARKWEAARFDTLGEMHGPWSELLDEARRLPDGDPVAMVNQWVNWHVRYRDDLAGDEWSPAAETLTRGYGDCEDFALAKMALLSALGVPSDSMFLVLLRDRRQMQHAVLAVSRDGRLWVLDNRTDKVLPADVIADYTPILSFSGHFAWTYGARAG